MKLLQALNPLGRSAGVAVSACLLVGLAGLAGCSSSTESQQAVSSPGRPVARGEVSPPQAPAARVPARMAASYQGPRLSAQEKHDHDRCVAALGQLWGADEVKTSTVERGRSGLDYVWVNVEVHDDDDDLDRRIAHGATQGGHCQFEHPGQAMHVHAYPLVADGDEGYRFFTLDPDGMAVAAAPESSGAATASVAPAAQPPQP